MGLVVSMVMITIGAVMRFAVSATAEGIDVHMVGVILMLVGILGAVLSIAFWASWGGFNNIGGRRTTVVTSAPVVTAAPTTVERTVVRQTKAR
jgi:hypothetical protein